MPNKLLPLAVAGLRPECSANELAGNKFWIVLIYHPDEHFALKKKKGGEGELKE